MEARAHAMTQDGIAVKACVGGAVRSMLTRALLVATALGVVGCATYGGTAVNAPSTLPQHEPGWIWISGVPEVRQEGAKDCGAAALSAVLRYWGHPVTPRQIELDLRPPEGAGISAGALAAYARAHGFDAYVFNGALADIVSELRNGRPTIVGVAKHYDDALLAHYEVVTAWNPSTPAVLTLDPDQGWRKNASAGFLNEWNKTGRVLIVVFPAGHQG